MHMAMCASSVGQIVHISDVEENSVRHGQGRNVNFSLGVGSDVEDVAPSAGVISASQMC